MRIAALGGGAGAAKFLTGLVAAADPSQIVIIGNTGDDAEFYGLHVSPDLDIVTYTLAGLVGAEGWGFKDDGVAALEQLGKYGLDTWFRIGDKDLATHVARTFWLRSGATLSEATDRIRRALGVEPQIIPMSDDPVRTRLTTSEGRKLEFQEYFVKERHRPEIVEIEFLGSGESSPAPGVLSALEDADIIIVCPSNPLISIGPILSVPGVRDALKSRRDRVVAVSPIVEGAALKGPADRLLPIAGVSATASGVATLYKDFCSTFVVDVRDKTEAAAVEDLGMRTLITDTVMKERTIAIELSRSILGTAG